MREFLLVMGRIASYIFPFKIRNKLNAAISIFYTGLRSIEFNYLGEGVYVRNGLVVEGGQYVSVGKNSFIGKNVEITAIDNYLGEKFTPEIKIGDGVSINSNSHITCINKIIIGNDVRAGRRVTITDNAHGKSNIDNMTIPPVKRMVYSQGSVIIEDKVWIGNDVIILPNVTIGEGSIIGANSVVTRNVPPYCVVGGNPAKILKKNH